MIGRCPTCDGEYELTKDRLIRRHGPRKGVRCSGSGMYARKAEDGDIEHLWVVRCNACRRLVGDLPEYDQAAARLAEHRSRCPAAKSS